MANAGKRVVVLGSTGNLGRSTLDVIARHRGRFDAVGLVAGRNADLLAAQARDFPGALMAIGDREALAKLTSKNPDLVPRVAGAGEEGIVQLLERARADLVVNCMVGFAGLKPTLHALEKGIPVALANKEAVVCGGAILMAAARKSGAALVPVDSEHVAIAQCLRGRSVREVAKIYITASGGALRDRPLPEVAAAKVEDVLEHPTWKMGDKITVDSATMLNKGLEVIEAYWLFGVPFETIEVVLHPQSVVHSLVEFRDGCILAQLSVPDMRLPILFALSYPESVKTDMVTSRVTQFPPLSFAEVDHERYPCLSLCLEAGRIGGNRPTVLSSANEEAVAAFLRGKITFGEIYQVIVGALEGVPYAEVSSIDDILSADTAAREYVRATFRLN